jgi:TonB family protein
MTPVNALIVACVRCWTRVYTWRLPPELRDARRAEIESDLWEGLHDPRMTPSDLNVQMVTRLTLGAVDDLAWRLTQGTVSSAATLRRRAAAAVVVCALVMLAGLLTPGIEPPDLPEVRGGAFAGSDTRPYPPPPPPPPPQGATRGETPSFQYGRSAYSVEANGQQPVLIREVQAVYPPVAVAAGVEGDALVQARITERGRVEDAEVAPADLFGRSAIEAVKQWEFAAAGTETLRPALLKVRVSFRRSQ